MGLLADKEVKEPHGHAERAGTGEPLEKGEGLWLTQPLERHMVVPVPPWGEGAPGKPLLLSGWGKMHKLSYMLRQELFKSQIKGVRDT